MENKKNGRPIEEPTNQIRVPVNLQHHVKDIIQNYKIARKNGVTSVTIGEVTISTAEVLKGKNKKEIINEVYLKSR